MNIFLCLKIQLQCPLNEKRQKKKSVHLIGQCLLHFIQIHAHAGDIETEICLKKRAAMFVSMLPNTRGLVSSLLN